MVREQTQTRLYIKISLRIFFQKREHYFFYRNPKILGEYIRWARRMRKALRVTSKTFSRATESHIHTYSQVFEENLTEICYIITQEL